jgi:hypothetical protein
MAHYQAQSDASPVLAPQFSCGTAGHVPRNLGFAGPDLVSTVFGRLWSLVVR